MNEELIGKVVEMAHGLAAVKFEDGKRCLFELTSVNDWRIGDYCFTRIGERGIKVMRPVVPRPILAVEA